MPMPTSRLARTVLVGAWALIAAGCGGGGTTVDATLRDFRIALGADSGPSGEVTFRITNEGPSVHEFVVFRTDLAPDQLPTTEENGVPVVDEEAPGLTLVDEREDINPNTSTDLAVDLAPGKYVIVCNVPDHYRLGMRASFTVSG